jgi:hypothetical protein
MLSQYRVYYLFLLISILISSSVIADDGKNTRDKLMIIIDEELKEIDRLSRQSKKFNSELQFRKAETILEKGRLIKESENEDFLNVDAKYRGKMKRQQFFRQSYRYFLWAKQIATTITKKDPKYKRSAELYYILGFYEKEFGKDVLALNYFKKADAASKDGSDFNLRCKSALAETYYNQKNYVEAKKYYEITLKRINDKWWTKDAYSLAWSYHKTNNSNAAINTMKTVIERSKSGNYIDMNFIAYKDIGLFYAESNRADEGVKYFKSQNKDVVVEMLTIASYLRDKGNYLQTLEVYDEAIDSTVDEKLKAKVYIEKLILADKFFRQDQHIKDSQKLFNIWKQGHLDEAQQKTYVLQMKKQVALVQRKMDSKYKGVTDKVLKERAFLAENYFAMLSQVDSKNLDEYQFYNAESQFQTKQYERAAVLYQASFDKAKENNNLKMMKLSAEGLLAALGPDSPDFKSRNEYYETAYKNYLEVDQSSTKSEDIYRRLYKLLYQQGDVDGMKAVLQDYSKNFAKNTQEQDQMVASLLSVYEKKKQNDQAAALIDEVQGGRYFVSNKLKGEVYGVKQKMEIKEVEGLIASGDNKSAIKGYDKIYKDPKSTKLTKANAAYNLMVLSYKNNELTTTYNWGVESLELMGDQFVTGNIPSFVAISKYLFERMQFQASADLAHRALAKICSASQVQYKRVLLNNAVLSYRAAEQNKKLLALIDAGKTCRVPDDAIFAAEVEYLDSLREKKSWNELVRRIESTNYSSMTYSTFELEYLLDICLESDEGAGSQKCSQLKRAADNVARQGLKVSGRALDAITYARAEQIWNDILTWQSQKLRFPEKTYNDILTVRLKKLEKIVEDLLSLQKTGSRLGIVQSFEMLAYCYHKMAREINTFTPEGVSSDYLQSFKSSMAQVAQSLAQKSIEYKNQFTEIASKQELIAPLREIYPIAIPMQTQSGLKVMFNQEGN